MTTNSITVQKQEYKSVIFSGYSIESNGVSICNLNDYVTRVTGRSALYQVWSDRHRVYDVFHNIDDAVNKFLELKDKR